MEERAAVPLPDVIPRDSLYAQTPVEPAPAPSLGVPVDTAPLEEAAPSLATDSAAAQEGCCIDG